MSRTDRMASDLSRTGPVERDIEQVIFLGDFVCILISEFDFFVCWIEFFEFFFLIIVISG